MSVIIDIDHESNDFSEYTSTVEDSGDLSVAAGAALAGTNYGMQCVIDDTTVIYGEYNLGTSDTSGVFRARFYFDPAGYSISTGNTLRILDIYSFDVVDRLVGFAAFTSYLGSNAVRVGIYADSGVPTQSTPVNISDAEHYIEVKLTRATGSTSNDGRMDWWIDGSSQTAVTGIDNYDRFLNFDSIRLGAPGIVGTPTGTYYLDELVANNDGGEIGPVSAGANIIPLIVHHMKQQGMS